MVTIIFFLSSGLFLGWSLGANDAANVFGTAVSSKMIKFTTAAWICSVFVIIGSVLGGAGGSHTLGKLGEVNTLAGSFTVAFSAAWSVFFMTKAKIPVSTSQAIVGAIIGWNFFSGTHTNPQVLMKIAGTWIICPFLSMLFSIILFICVKFILQKTKMHLFRLDLYTRRALIITGAFGAYSLGANNIANVMGVFIASSPFKNITHNGHVIFSNTQILFLIGSLAISAGVFTYSKKVMTTVGKDIFKLSPITALIVVLSSSMVLFIFASSDLQQILISLNLPPIPLVPVSSSQAVIGAVIGIGIIKKARNVNYQILGRISIGWVATPIIAAILSFVMLFFVQNVFMNKVFL